MNNTFWQVNRTVVITSLLLLLVGLTYAGLSVYSIITTERFIASAPTTEARVVNVSRRRSREGGYRTRVYVTYSVDGEEYEYIHATNAHSSVAKDEMIMVHYDPENPRRIAAADQSYTSRLLGAVVGLLMAGFGIRRVFRARKAWIQSREIV